MTEILYLLVTVWVLASGTLLVIGLLSLTFMLALRIQTLNLSLTVQSSPSAIPSPSDAGVQPAGRGPKSSGEVAGGGVWRFEDQARDEPEPSAPQVPAPLDLAEPAGSLRTSDGLEDALDILHRSVGEIFPANRVTMRCSRCGHFIPRFEGYRHIKVGERKTYCRDCQEAMGLPLREASDASAGLVCS